MFIQQSFNSFTMKIQLIALALIASLAQPVVGFHPYSRTNALHKPRSDSRESNLLTKQARGVVAQRMKTTGSRPTGLRSSSTKNDTPAEGSKGDFDAEAVLKYGVALTTELGLFYGIFTGLDMLVASTGVEIPIAVNFIFFYLCALKSRVLNPLLNKRPQPKNLELDDDASKRVMPSWTPPGVVFPIMWLLIIGPMRAASSVLVYQAAGSFANPAILSLMLHLSIGDVWNTINNTERRYGAAVTGVGAVLVSAASAAYQYSLVDEIAGKVLGATCIWLTVATALITATWQLNPDPVTGEPEPLYPVKGSTKTEFLWFAGKEKSD
jgi:benzodiazapine receptor